MVQDFLEHLAAGEFNVMIGNGKSVTDNVHVDSVVDAHFLLAKKLGDEPELVGGQAYFAYAFAYLGEVAHDFGGPFPMLTRRGVRSVCRDASFRIDKARAHLGYEPRTSAAEGIPALMDDFRAAHDRMRAAQ